MPVSVMLAVLAGAFLHAAWNVSVKAGRDKHLETALLLAGGALVDAISWRWVLFVNVPIGLALILIGPAVLPRTQRRPGRLDLPGALTVSGGLSLAVYGLERTASWGWGNAATLAVFAGAVVLMAGFVLIERTTTAALVPVRFLAHRNRGGGFAVMLLLGGAMLALLYFLTQFLQEVLHYSPIEAGLAYLPLPVAVGVTGLVVSRLVGRFGIRPFLLAGPLLVAAGLWWVSGLSAASRYVSVFGPLVVVGFGMGLSFVPLTLNAVAEVVDREAGLASGLLNTSQQFGGSLGLAALVTVAAGSAGRHVAAAGHGLGSAVGGAGAGVRTASLAEAARVAGFQAALRGGALAAGVAFFFSLLVLRTVKAPAKLA
jgi:MFS family permease